MSNLQILLCDNNIKERDSLASRFRLAGHAIITADSGFHIIHLCEKQKYDVIILGEKLSDMPGREALTLLRQAKTAVELPIVFMSAETTKEDLNLLLEWGANEVVQKTTNFNLYLNALKNIKKS
jgi:DNA-binding response OmpR family regulator